MEIEKTKEQEFIEAVKKLAQDGKMSCAIAMAIADKHNYPRDKMANLLTENKIKLKNCQLGCFK